MIIVIGGIKGGSGKTTIATNLAVMRSMSKKVLLVDADEQKSAWDWSQQRDQCLIDSNTSIKPHITTVCMSGKLVYLNILRLKEDYEHIIIDTGGRDTTSQRSALCIADKLILPFKPSSIDIWTLVPIMGIISECVNTGLKVCAFINQADATGNDNREAIDILMEFDEIQTLDCLIGNRKAFRNAAAEGKGVIELTAQDKKACDEIQKLYDLIYN